MDPLDKILSSLRKAEERFDMIEDGDRIAVGVSGGKDSLALLAALAAYRRFGPRFTLFAVTIDLGRGADYGGIEAFCRDLSVPFSAVKTDIARIVFDERREKNPCSLCSKMRRGALVGEAKRMGANKLALGHHADDFAETFLLSLFFEGRLAAMKPTIAYDGLTVIRPLMFVREKDIVPLGRRLPVISSACPADGNTRRAYIKELLRGIKREIPFAEDRLLSALFHPERNDLLESAKK